MGSGTDFVLGGLLGGVGRGIEQDALANRQVALERLREQYQENREAVADQRQEVRDKRVQGYALDRAEVDTENDIRKLRVGGEIQTRRDEGGRAHEVRMARLQSELQGARTEREIRLRDRLNDDDVNDVVVGEDGNYYIVRNNGALEPTHVSARPLSTSTTEGGRLTESEQDTAFSSAHRQWVQHGREGREPQRQDFIGMSREDYRRIYGGQSAPARATPAEAPRRVIRYDANGNRIGG